MAGAARACGEDRGEDDRRALSNECEGLTFLGSPVVPLYLLLLVQGSLVQSPIQKWVPFL